MGQYTETIKKREAQDRYIAELHEKYLLGERLCADESSARSTGDTIAALQYILRRYDQKLHRAEDCKSIQEVFDRMLEPAGILCEEIESASIPGKKGNDCVLAYTEDGLAVVITPTVFGSRYYIPSEDRYGRLNGKIKFRDRAYVIGRPIPAENFSLGSFTGYVLRLIAFRDWIGIAAAAALISLLGVLIPEINRLVLGTYVRLPLSDALFLLLTACAELAVVYIFRTVFRFIKEIVLASIRLGNEIKVESAFMSRILLLPMGYFRENTSGRISANILFSKKLSDTVTAAIVGTSVSALFSLIYLGEIAAFPGRLLGVVLAISLVKLTLAVVANIFEAENLSKITENDSVLRDNNYSVFKGIQKLKTSGAENRIYAQWATLFYTKLQLMFNPRFILKIKPVLRTAVSAAGTIILLLTAAGAELSAGDYIAFISVYELFDLAIEQIADVSEKVAAARPYINRLKPILAASCRNDTEKDRYVRSVNGGVVFDRVCLRYEGNADFCLDNVSFRIRPGEKVAVVGASGSGKSTLLSLITGLNAPSSGEVYIDGDAISHINQRSLCRQIGSVSQFSKLFPGTIRFNVSIGNEEMSDEEVWKALDAAAIGDTVRGYPLGLDTEISESQSGGLSGGQRQRLLLARCFASHHRLILLDESTSALDNVTQEKVLKNIYALDATVIMVAHRLSTIKQCSRIFVMDDGAIAEEGTYDQLMEKRGLFFELAKKQISEP